MKSFQLLNIAVSEYIVAVWLIFLHKIYQCITTLLFSIRLGVGVSLCVCVHIYIYYNSVGCYYLT